MVNGKQKGKRGEVWKPVVGFEGLYEVSNKGRVKSLPRTTTHGVILKNHINKRNGYVYACLSKNNKRYGKRVHVLVMQSFYGYESNKEFVIDHLDCDKTNNCIENLEIVTQKENDRRSRKNKLQIFDGVKVIDTDTLQVFGTYTEAAKSIGGKHGEMVARVCRGERSHYRNRHFARLTDYENGTVPKFSGKNKRKASESLWR